MQNDRLSVLSLDDMSESDIRRFIDAAIKTVTPERFPKLVFRTGVPSAHPDMLACVTCGAKCLAGPKKRFILEAYPLHFRPECLECVIKADAEKNDQDFGKSQNIT